MITASGFALKLLISCVMVIAIFNFLSNIFGTSDHVPELNTFDHVMLVVQGAAYLIGTISAFVLLWSVEIR